MATASDADAPLHFDGPADWAAWLKRQHASWRGAWLRIAKKGARATLDSQNRYAVLFRLQTGKRAETRARRLANFVAMLARGEKLHP